MTDKPSEHIVQIDVGPAFLEGELIVPSSPQGAVLFAHGSGSSRHSPRNTFVAHVLQRAGFATLLLDLLTKAEDLELESRFDIELLTSRLVAATRWLRREPLTSTLQAGYFGASTGAAAALQAAVEVGSEVAAIVSRGGRPDLAHGLDRVTTPTMLLVGSRDEAVLELNQEAYRQLGGEKELVVIPGATHLFEEPGALDEVARQASSWFARHLAQPDVEHAGRQGMVVL